MPWSVLGQILAALEGLLDLAIDFFEAEGELGGDRVDAAVDADGLHALQELDVQKGLRGRGFLEEGLVEGERVERPLHDSLQLRLREEIRLAQDVDKGQSMSKLDRGVQEDGRDEAAGALHERRVVQIDERAILAPERIDQDRTGRAEREELDLARRVDQVIVRLKGFQDVRELLGVHRGHVRGGDLRAVRPEALFRHDLLQVHVVPHVEVRGVQQRLRTRIEIHRNAVEALGVHPELERVDHRRLPGPGGAEEVTVTGHGTAEYELERDEGSRSMRSGAPGA